MNCDRCKINDAEVKTIEGFNLCSGCDSIRLNCINEVTEKRSLKDFKKEIDLKRKFPYSFGKL